MNRCLLGFRGISEGFDLSVVFDKDRPSTGPLRQHLSTFSWRPASPRMIVASPVQKHELDKYLCGEIREILSGTFATGNRGLLPFSCRLIWNPSLPAFHKRRSTCTSLSCLFSETVYQGILSDFWNHAIEFSFRKTYRCIRLRGRLLFWSNICAILRQSMSSRGQGETLFSIIHVALTKVKGTRFWNLPGSGLWHQGWADQDALRTRNQPPRLSWCDHPGFHPDKWIAHKISRI